MADRLQWLLELEDRLSGPAARIERQLERVRAQMKAMDIAARTNAIDKMGDGLKKQRAELALQRDKLLLSKSALDKTSDSSGTFISRLHSLLHIAQIVGSALEKVGHVAVKVGKDIVGAISFKQGSMIGLETFLGAKAGGVFERMEALASRTGQTAAEVVGLAKSLAMAGVAADDLEPIMKRLAGLNKISAGSGNTVGGVIANMFSAGKGTAGDIEALRGTPINVEKVYEDLSEKLTGVRNRIAGKALAEQLGSEQGIGKNLLTSLILGDADKLGAIQKGLQGGKTLEGQMEGVRTNIDRMFTKLSGSPGIRAFQSVLSNLQDIFDPNSKSGGKMLQNLNRISDAIAAALDPLTGKEGRQRMTDFFVALGELIDAAIPKIAKLVEWTGKVVEFVAARTQDKTTTQLLSEQMAAEGGNAAFGSPYAQFSRPTFGLFGQRDTPLAPVVHVTQHIDARGATKDDAEQIADRAAQKAVDALTGALRRAQPPAPGGTP